MLAQIFFIVWRESVEALLVIGILSAWMTANDAAAGGKKRGLMSRLLGAA